MAPASAKRGQGLHNHVAVLVHSRVRGVLLDTRVFLVSALCSESYESYADSLASQSRYSWKLHHTNNVCGSGLATSTTGTINKMDKQLTTLSRRISWNRQLPTCMWLPTSDAIHKNLGASEPHQEHSGISDELSVLPAGS